MYLIHICQAPSQVYTSKQPVRLDRRDATSENRRTPTYTGYGYTDGQNVLQTSFYENGSHAARSPRLLRALAARSFVKLPARSRESTRSVKRVTTCVVPLTVHSVLRW